MVSKHPLFTTKVLSTCNKLSSWDTSQDIIITILVGLPRCKNLWHFFFVFLARAGVWLLFNGLSALLFSLFYLIREFDMFLHRGWTEKSFSIDHFREWRRICYSFVFMLIRPTTGFILV